MRLGGSLLLVAAGGILAAIQIGNLIRAVLVKVLSGFGVALVVEDECLLLHFQELPHLIVLELEIVTDEVSRSFLEFFVDLRVVDLAQLPHYGP